MNRAAALIAPSWLALPGIVSGNVPASTPLEALVLFKVEPELARLVQVANGPVVEIEPLAAVPNGISRDAELAILLEEEECPAAATAPVVLRVSCAEAEPSAAGRQAWLDQLLRCHQAGAVATVLPRARKVVGPAAMAALAPTLDSTVGCQRLLVQIHVVQDDTHAWTHTHGMAHYGLPDLECRTTLAGRATGLRLLEGGIAQLLVHGAASMPLGGLMDATEPDGLLLGAFEVHPARAVEGHNYDTWGALELVPLVAGIGDDPPEGTTMTDRALLEELVRKRQRVRGMDLREADLRHAALAGLEVEDADLSGAGLDGVDLRQARLRGCLLQDGHLQDADLSGAVLRACVLDGAHVAHARLDGTRLEDSSAAGADLQGASLREAHLSETGFERARMRDAVLDGARGDGIVFRGAELVGASLRGVRFEDADFRGADLRGACLAGGSFRHADFRGALLDGADFDGADCQGAEFDREAGQPAAAGFPRDGATTAERFVALEALMEDLAGRLDEGGAPRTELLSSLMKQAGIPDAAGELAPAQAAMLRQVLGSLRDLQLPLDRPEELVPRLQAVLENALPQLRGTLGDEIWRPLADLLAQAQQGIPDPAERRPDGD